MANKTETRPRPGADTVDRSAALRNVMEVLSAKGFAKASTARLEKRNWTRLRRTPQGLRNQGRDSPRCDPVLRRHGGMPGPGDFARIADWQRSDSRDAGRECAVAPALAQILRLPIHVHRLYHPSRGRRPAGLPSREASISLETHSRADRAVREGRRTS